MIASVPSPNASGTVASPVQVSDSPVASVQNAIVPDTTYTTASAVQVPDSLIAPVLKRIHPFFLPPPRVVAPVTEGLTHEMRFNALARQEAVPALPQPRHRQTGRLRLRLSTPPFIQTDVLCLPPRLLGRPRHPILMSADTEHPPLWHRPFILHQNLLALSHCPPRSCSLLQSSPTAPRILNLIYHQILQCRVIMATPPSVAKHHPNISVLQMYKPLRVCSNHPCVVPVTCRPLSVELHHNMSVMHICKPPCIWTSLSHCEAYSHSWLYLDSNK